MKRITAKPWHYLAMGTCCGLAVVMSLLFCAALGARWIEPAEPVVALVCAVVVVGMGMIGLIQCLLAAAVRQPDVMEIHVDTVQPRPNIESLSRPKVRHLVRIK